MYRKSLEQANSQRNKVEQCLPGAGIGRGEENGDLFNKYRISIWGDEKNLEMDNGNGHTPL